MRVQQMVRGRAFFAAPGRMDALQQLVVAALLCQRRHDVGGFVRRMWQQYRETAAA